MGCGWNKIRDLGESVASLVGNYELPGSSLITDKLVSKGSQDQLSSGVGELAQVGTGLAGAGVGSSVTGIPQSAGGALEASALSSAGNAISDAASSVGSGISNAVSDGGNVASTGTSLGDVASSAPIATSSPSFDTTAASFNPNIDNSLNVPSVNPTSSTTFDATANNFNQNINSSLNNLASGGTGDTVSSGGGTTGSGILTKIENAISAHPTAAINAGLGLANVIKGNSALPGQKQLSNEAGQLSAQGQQLQSYLQSGTLPAGLQQSINQTADAMKAQIRSQHAANGTSGSSAEQQELAAVDQQMQAQGATMAMQLLQQGVSETGLSAQLYSQIMNSKLSQDQNLAKTLASVGSALVPNSGTKIAESA